MTTQREAETELAAIKDAVGPEPVYDPYSANALQELANHYKRRAAHFAARNAELEALLRESRNYVMVFSPSGAPFDFPRDVIARIDAAIAANQQEQQK